jgi:hypothetical protein
MTQNPQQPPEPERRGYEYRPHHEKDEKEEEKRHEKGRGDASWDEKWRRDPINAGAWAAILIWVGLTLLGNTTGWGPDTFSWWHPGNWWAVAMAGAGVILIICALIRLAKPEHRRPIIGNMIMGVIFLGIGMESLSDWNWGVAGAIILIVIGVLIILSGFFRRRR